MVIPIADENPARRAALVTWLLIALNVLVFLFEPIARAPVTDPGGSLAQVCRQERFFRRYAAIPKELTSNEQLPVTAGDPVPGQGCEAVPARYHKVPVVSVFYAMFLHGGLLHLAGNMLFLFVFGNNVEDRLGRLHFLLFYLAAGYVATYVFAFANPDSTTSLVGASGAIAGVLGAYLVYFPRARVTSLVPFLFFLPARLPAWAVLGSWFLLQWAYASGTAVAAGGGVAYLAHVAGFLAGVVYALALRDRDAAGHEP